MKVWYSLVDLKITVRIAAIIISILAVFISSCQQRIEDQTIEKPNIIIILADDMGYGDIEALNPESKIPTPHLNQLASEGMIFTDAHSNSAVCTPTRYGLLTGRYCFRTRLKSGVLAGFSPSLIEPGRETIASFLQKQGYHTACVGKWHLGVDWKKKNPEQPLWEGFQYRPSSSDNVDYTAPVDGGPVDHGFDYGFIAPAAISFPYCYIENEQVLDTNMYYREAREETVKGVHWRDGHSSESFEPEKVMHEITNKALSYVKDINTKQPGKPFFLYFPLTAPHRPYVPVDRFLGKSGAGLYGDFCMEVDYTVGQVMQLLDSLKIAENTLLIFTSDNGSRWDQEEINQYDHRSNYIFRGMKSMLYEGGHRVPFIVRWPGKVEEASASDQMVNMTDFLATFADYFHADLEYNAGEDSYSFLPALLNQEADLPMRDHLINRSFKGKTAIRKGPWKLLLHDGHGGIFIPDTAKYDTRWQLYNLDQDPGEKNNVYLQHKTIADSLHNLFRMYDEEERSRFYSINEKVN